MSWLRKLICLHKWKVRQEQMLQWRGNTWDGYGRTGTGTRFILQCEHCGEIKKKDVK